MSTDSSEEVVLLKERYIPASKDHFLSVLLDKFDTEKEKEVFGKLCSSIEALFYVNRISRIESFKKCYSCFDRRSELVHKLSSSELCSRQNQLIFQIYSILSAAHFDPITFSMYKNSIEKVFLSDLPIKVDFGKLDSFLFTEFYKKYPSKNPYKKSINKPPFYKHFSMFYRGYGLNKMNGLFITQKFNLILADIIPIITSFIFKTNCKKDIITSVDPLLIDGNVAKDIDMLTLERISLLDTYNTAKLKNGFRGTLWWLFKNVNIQEPTFKKLILIYRLLPESFIQSSLRKWKITQNNFKKKIQKKVGIKDDKKGNIVKDTRDELRRRRRASQFQIPDICANNQIEIDSTFEYPINIKYFSNIPMSDLEITYPSKSFALKPMDNLYIGFTVFIGVYAVIKEVLYSVSTWYGYVMIITCILLMIRSLIWYRATESEYVRVLNQNLVDSNISTDQDTIISIIDNINEQEFMETILTYFILLKNKIHTITCNDDIDRLCETFIANEFGLNINTMIDGAMNKLSELGLLTIDGKSKLDNIQVKGLDKSLLCVQQHYKSASQSFRKLVVDFNDNDNDNNGKGITDDPVDDDNDNDDDDDEKVANQKPIIDQQQISDNHFDHNDKTDKNDKNDKNDNSDKNDDDNKKNTSDNFKAFHPVD